MKSSPHVESDQFLKDLPYNCLNHLLSTEKRMILKLMARVAEASFRQGYTEGRSSLLDEDLNYCDPSELWDFSLDRSPDLDRCKTGRLARNCKSSVTRLKQVFARVLWCVGLVDYDDPALR